MTGPAVPILVVDDDVTKRLLLTTMLSPLGYRIVEAVSGADALRCLLAEDFAVILLDIRMPGMDGVETARLIRSRSRSEFTPIILITASTRSEVASSRPCGDTDGLMFGSLEPEELLATVQSFGNQFRQTQHLVRQARAALTAADRWQRVAGTVPVGIFQTDAQHRYTYTNPQWSQITGIPAVAALGQDWRMIVDAEQAARLVAGSGSEVAARAEVSHRLELRGADGDSKVVVLTSKLILDRDGASTGWVGSLSDVTRWQFATAGA